jgi:CcmD family protein
MKIIKPFLSALFALLFVSTAFSQSDSPEMADTMRSEGKIYVVVAIFMIILTGLIGYLVRMDRKLTRLEKKLPGDKA